MYVLDRGLFLPVPRVSVGPRRSPRLSRRLRRVGAFPVRIASWTTVSQTSRKRSTQAASRAAPAAVSASRSQRVCSWTRKVLARSSSSGRSSRAGGTPPRPREEARQEFPRAAGVGSLPATSARSNRARHSVPLRLGAPQPLGHGFRLRRGHEPRALRRSERPGRSPVREDRLARCARRSLGRAWSLRGVAASDGPRGTVFSRLRSCRVKTTMSGDPKRRAGTRKSTARGRSRRMRPDVEAGTTSSSSRYPPATSCRCCAVDFPAGPGRASSSLPASVATPRRACASPTRSPSSSREHRAGAPRNRRRLPVREPARGTPRGAPLALLRIDLNRLFPGRPTVTPRSHGVRPLRRRPGRRSGVFGSSAAPSPFREGAPGACAREERSGGRARARRSNVNVVWKRNPGPAAPSTFARSSPARSCSRAVPSPAPAQASGRLLSRGVIACSRALESRRRSIRRRRAHDRRTDLRHRRAGPPRARGTRQALPHGATSGIRQGGPERSAR